MKRLFTFILFAAFSVAMFGISGHITTDTTWSTDQIVTGALFIDEGITLSIMPGVRVTFPRIDQNADGIGDVYIEVSGRLQVQGTVASKVIFTSNQTDPAPSDWLGIKYITPQSGMLSTISNAEILYAREPLFVNGRNLTLNNMRIAYSGDYGMRINNTFLTTSITNCTIEENTGYGLLIEAGPVNITGLAIFHNSGYGVKIQPNASVVATDIVASTNTGFGIWVIGNQVSTFTNCRSISNAKSGVWLDGATSSFTNCDISNNSMFGVKADSTGADLSFTNCNISSNAFGISLNSSSPTFSFCNIEHNQSGIAIYRADPVFSNCNITDNGQTTPTSMHNYSFASQNDWKTLSGAVVIPNAIYNLLNPDNSMLLWSMTYKKDGDWTYTYDLPFTVYNYTRVNVNSVTKLVNEYSGVAGYFPMNPPYHYQADMPEITLAGDLHELINSQNNLSLDLYYQSWCNNARAWVTDMVIAQGNCTVNNLTGTSANLQNNWWGQVTGIDSLIVQLVIGTANYSGSMTSRILSAGCTLSNLSPAITLLTPAVMVLNPATYSITWTDRDLDDNAIISLYYTEDPAQTGTLIADNISEDSPVNTYTWDCSSVPYGTYYIKAVISDGVNPPVSSISPGRIMVGALQVKMPDNATGVAGTQVLIPVQTVNSTDYFNIISFQFTLTYSNNIIQGVGVDTENTLTGETWTVYANTSIPGQISVNGFSFEPLNASGNLVNIVFDVQPGAANYATSPLNFADCILNNGTPEPTLVNGLFSVVNQYSISGNVHYYMGTSAPIANVALSLTGDQTYQALTEANGDFVLPPCPAGNYVLTPSCTTAIPGLVVTPYDASLTAQFALGLYPFTNEQQKAADVNGDFQATVFDAALIAQYSVGLITEFTPGIWGFSPPNQNYNLVSNFTNVQFLGYAIGDPSGNWSTRGDNESSGAPISVSAGKGSVISIPITWDQEFVSAFVQMNYDPQQLRYLGTEHSSAANAMQHTENVSDGILRIAAYGIEPVNSTEPVYNIRFEVLDGSSAAVVHLDAVQFDETPADLGNTGIVAGEIPPVALSLSQNYPNPFNPVTNISYGLPTPTRVRLHLFNLKGQLVKELVNDTQQAGNYTVSLDASGLGSGIYFYRLITDSGSITRKMVLSK